MKIKKSLSKNLNRILFEAGIIVRKRNITSQTDELNPSTNVDLEVSEFISKRITKLIEVPVLSEEAEKEQSILDNEYVWVIDPLDGTLNYLTNNNQYGISVSLVDTKKMNAILAANYLPSLDSIYYAILGEGAFLNNSKIIPDVNPHKIISYGLPYDASLNSEFHSEKIKELIKNEYIIRQSGSAIYDILETSTGRLKGFFEFGLFIWDFIGADLIAIESGCKTYFQKSEISSNDLFRYDYFVADSEEGLNKLKEVIL